MTMRNSIQTPVTDTQRSGQTLSGLDRMREAAQRDRHLRLSSLMHHITPELLYEGYCALKRQAAPGVDGVTWAQYGEKLDARIAGLHDRVQNGRYEAPPSKRVYIAKPDGTQRPLGIASLEDKIVQQAVAWVMSAIFEVDFMGFSYGFRPGRSPHRALDALWVSIVHHRVNWVLDADIRNFFDTLDHGQLLEFVEYRISDPRMMRLIRKWLRAGISENGERSITTVGVPQGGVISPLLANIYLHHVLDLWVQEWRDQHAHGEFYIVRYADDFVLGFQYKTDADRFLVELRERLCNFHLELHDEKTRLIEFGRFAISDRAKRGVGKPGTFEFLGFTHICANRRTTGRFTVLRKSSAKRLRSKIKVLRRVLMARRHEPLASLGRWLRSVVRGYYSYHAVPGNFEALVSFRRLIGRVWRIALRSRSQRARKLAWSRMNRIIDTWLPRPRILHPYPGVRFGVGTCGRSRMR